MLRIMCKSKIHQATVTETNLNYIGSLTIDENLMKTVDIVPYERVDIWNLNNGARLTTYAIPGKKNSGIICANGASARFIQRNDKIIIVSWALVNEEDLKNFKPKIIFLDEKNRIKK